MVKYLFILGRNLELSKAELFSYFEREGNKILSDKLIGNGFLVESEREIPQKIIETFGGVISIGKVLCKAENSELEKVNLYNGTKNNINFCIWEFGEVKEIRDYLKKRFGEERLKASEKHMGSFIDMQGGESVKNLGHKKTVDEEYFIFEDYFGRITQRSDYEKIEKRDMEKPFRRSDLAISPRLAKIMINLSQVKKGDKLLDPFCGIGVVLQESLLQGIKAVGVEIDKDAAEKAVKNLEWGRFNKKNYKIINGDSKKVGVEKVDVIVSEPDLGETLKKTTNEEKAKRIINDYENLMINVLNNMKKITEGRIVFTAPLIMAHKKRIGCDKQRILQKTGLKLAKGFPIPEYREEQVVGREIIVLNK